MSSYILGDSWPTRPWVRYMKESTYRHDFGQGKNDSFRKPYPQSYYDNIGSNNFSYKSMPLWGNDDTRLPLDQGRGYNNYREEGGPYTDRGDYGRGFNNYDDGPYTDRPGYDRRPDPRDGYDRRPEPRDGYDRRPDPRDGYDRRPDPRDGPYTDRGGYERRMIDDPYIAKRHERPDEGVRFQEPPNYDNNPGYENPPMFDKYGPYGPNRTTQRDYGDFKSNPRRGRVDVPHAYRGEVDKEIEAFHNKDNDQTEQKSPEVNERGDNDDGKYIDEIYLRPEEKQVRHRNMEYEYDAQQRLPLNIAPQNDYKSVIQQPSRSESGAYLFIRTKKTAIDQIRLSFQKHKSILKMSGHLKGIATSDKISIIGDFTKWHIKSPMVRKGDNWYEQSVGGQEYMTDYIIICLWFPSVETAQLWKAYDFDFKRESFPEYEGCDLLVVPINYIPTNDIDRSTFVIMEFPDVLNKNALKQYVKDPMDDILSKDGKFEKCEPFVVWTDNAKNERGMMVSERSVVAVHRFTSIRQAREFYNDPRIERIRRELKDITKGGRHTAVIFQLVDFV